MPANVSCDNLVNDGVQLLYFFDGAYQKSFSSHYERMFGGFDGRWPPIIRAMLVLLQRMEEEINAPPLSCTTSHATVAFNRLHGEDRFVGWLYYGLCFVNGEGRQGDVPAYFIQDKDKVVHQAETVEEALAVMRRLIDTSPSCDAT